MKINGLLFFGGDAITLRDPALIQRSPPSYNLTNMSDIRIGTKRIGLQMKLPKRLQRCSIPYPDADFDFELPLLRSLVMRTRCCSPTTRVGRGS